ncbi:MAG: gliding motility lipoprotein GldB [Solitalea-like symbiont of Tyrophagus putrescentiae]
MNKLSILAIISISILTISLFACKRKHKLDIDTSNINVDITIYRFEKDLLSVDTNSIEASLSILKKKYDKFYDIFFNNIIVDRSKDTLHKNTVLKFITNSDFINLNNDVLKEYPDVKNLKQNLVEAFKHYKYYFPEKKLPTVVTFISGFENAIVNIDNILAIGLDMFLGKDYKTYLHVGFPKYIINRLSKEYIVPIAMQGFGKQEFSINDTDKSFINQMLYEGKILYFVDAMLPHLPDDLKLGYTKSQLNWALQYEPEIWTNFIDEDVLYTSDQRKYNKYIEEAPFSSGFYSDSAPRLASFTGLQIVRSYMANNPDITLPQLMEEQNPIKILNASKYKPQSKK